MTYSPAFLILMFPALFNRFPLVYFDTGTYLAAAIHRFNPIDRPFHYSVFLYALHLRQTLWPIVVAQAAITVGVLAIPFDVSLGPLRALHMATLVAISAAVSSLPVLASEIMPDLFTPLLVCSLVLLALHSLALTNVRKVFLYAVVLLAICVHQANFLLACALLLTLALVRSRLKPSLAGPLLAVCAGFGLLILPNAVSRHHRSFSTTRGSSVFMMAKLLDDGIGFDYLDEECKTIPFSICPELPILHQERQLFPNPDSSDFFLWGGPLQAAGDWEEVRKYAGFVVAQCIFRYPARFVLASVLDAGRQSILLSTGDGIVRYGDDAYVSTTLKSDFPAAVSNIQAGYLRHHFVVRGSGRPCEKPVRSRQEVCGDHPYASCWFSCKRIGYGHAWSPSKPVSESRFLSNPAGGNDGSQLPSKGGQDRRQNPSPHPRAT
jgi:hypothetical protein